MADKCAAELDQKLAEKRREESEVAEKHLAEIATLRNALEEKLGFACGVVILILKKTLPKKWRTFVHRAVRDHYIRRSIAYIRFKAFIKFVLQESCLVGFADGCATLR